MSEKHWKRLSLAERVALGKITAKTAAEALGISERQFRRVRSAIAEQGRDGVRHGNVGRAPSNRVSETTRARIVELARGRYAGFNDHHFTDKLHTVEGVQVSRATVQRILRNAAVASPRKRRAPRRWRRRERKSQEGMMLLWDGSLHRWLEDRGPRLCLMGAIDDATGFIMPGAHFVPAECSVGYLAVLLAICEQKGVPASIYMDRHSTLKRNDTHWSLEEQLANRRHKTQVGRALDELDVRVIFALSAQAKGRVERLWGTLQDRWVSELRLAQVHTAEAANAMLPRLIDMHNARFGRAAQDVESSWRPIDAQRARSICALSNPVSILNNHTVRLGGVLIDVVPAKYGCSYARKRADLRQCLDGSFQLFLNGALLQIKPVKQAAPRVTLGQARKPQDQFSPLCLPTASPCITGRLETT